jgi:transposase
MEKGRRVFSPEFRREALELLRQSGKSANELAKELGVNQTTLSRWKPEAQASVEPRNALPAAEELRQLRRENERLRMEREILKKAAAFFAQESS